MIPTESPSSAIPTSRPSISSRPTYTEAPSMPSQSPSHLPSSEPTHEVKDELPSSMPFHNPTNLPSMVQSTNPSNQPTAVSSQPSQHLRLPTTHPQSNTFPPSIAPTIQNSQSMALNIKEWMKHNYINLIFYSIIAFVGIFYFYKFGYPLIAYLVLNIRETFRYNSIPFQPKRIILPLYVLEDTRAKIRNLSIKQSPYVRSSYRRALPNASRPPPRELYYVPPYAQSKFSSLSPTQGKPMSPQNVSKRSLKVSWMDYTPSALSLTQPTKITKILNGNKTLVLNKSQIRRRKRKFKNRKRKKNRIKKVKTRSANKRSPNTLRRSHAQQIFHMKRSPQVDNLHAHLLTNKVKNRLVSTLSSRFESPSSSKQVQQSLQRSNSVDHLHVLLFSSPLPSGTQPLSELHSKRPQSVEQRPHSHHSFWTPPRQLKRSHRVADLHSVLGSRSHPITPNQGRRRRGRSKRRINPQDDVIL